MIFPPFFRDTGPGPPSPPGALPVPDLVAYGSAVSCCQRRWREALEVLEQMRRRGRDAEMRMRSEKGDIRNDTE